MPLTQTEMYPLTDSAFLEDPYPVYRRMRQRDPVYWSDTLGHWVLTRYDDVLAALRHSALSSDITEVSVRLTAEEVCAQCILLLGAGHITTMDQFGNTVLALLNNPEQLRLLCDNPPLVRSAVDEGLRYDGTAQFLQRIAREDLRLRGRKIRKGDLLYLSLGAANRDPAVFPEPDRFDIGRSQGRHLAFGAGAHLCLGMTLARRELESSLGQLVRRMPRLRLDEERPRRRRTDSLVFRGLESLPVRFD